MKKMVSPETRARYSFEKEIVEKLDSAVEQAGECNIFAAIGDLMRAEVEKSHERRFMHDLVERGLLSEEDQRELHEEHLSQVEQTQAKVVRILEENCGCRK